MPIINSMRLFHKIRSLVCNPNNRLEKKFAKEEWMKVLLSCQQEILQFNYNKYYDTDYHKAEKCYWINIPSWIYDDSKQHNIEKILDIGSGYGTLALFCKKLRGGKIYCIDYTDAYLSKSFLDKTSFEFKVNNIETDVFPWNEKFDAIICTEVIEHFNFHPVLTLKKIHDLLTPTGRLYLSTPDAKEWGRVTKYYDSIEDIPMPSKDKKMIDAHIFQYYKDELFDVLDKSGFVVERFDYSPGLVSRHMNLVAKSKN